MVWHELYASWSRKNAITPGEEVKEDKRRSKEENRED
jgi:hypothetical protein